MSERSDFLRCFTPVPEGAALPERISSAYDAESCLRRREDGGWTLRLRRRADGALYVLKADPAGNEDLPGEFQILTRLSPLLSGAVPEPAACFQEDGTTYLLRAFLPGETLRQYRERVGVCPEETCVRLGQKLCALLETLHSQEPPVIHRDIKPENIILLPDGGVGLIDFGIARLYKAGQDTDTRRMGTRSTAAPEQYGYAQTDQRTDLYALGMTLAWLATGAYGREALAQATNLSPYFRQTLEKAVSFAPEDRYQSAGDFSTALAGKAPPPRRRRWPVLAASLLLAVLAGVFWLGNGAPASGGDAEVQRKRHCRGRWNSHPPPWRAPSAPRWTSRRDPLCMTSWRRSGIWASWDRRPSGRSRSLNTGSAVMWMGPTWTGPRPAISATSPCWPTCRTWRSCISAARRSRTSRPWRSCPSLPWPCVRTRSWTCRPWRN